MLGVIWTRRGSARGVGRCVTEWNVYAQHEAIMIFMGSHLLEHYLISYCNDFYVI